MQNIIKKNIWFLIPYLLVCIAVIIIITVTSKPDLHLAINQFYSRFLDVLMMILTFFCNGLFACGLGLILLLVKIRYSLYMLGSYASSGLVVQLLKHFAFPGSLRPVPFLLPHELHLVQGISILNNYSFPSGHAATAFSVFFICSHLVTPRVVKLFMVIAAILVAFSRIYLSLHFLEDVLAGSFIGTAAAIASIYLTDRIKGEWAEKTVLTVSVNRKRNGAVH
jgi:membrane-associated phospholipid phosphatase